MCKKRNSVRIHIKGRTDRVVDKMVKIKDRTVRVDSCLKLIIQYLNELGYRTVASCCGHGIYKPTILILSWNIKNNKTYWNHVYDFFTDIVLHKTKKFYKKDAEGFYYIPEIEREFENLPKVKEIKKDER